MVRCFCLALSTLFLTCWCCAQNVETQNVQIPRHYDVVKAENGLIIGWQMASEDRAARQIDVYDMKGTFLTGLSPLRLVPEAKRTTVWDVSALPGQMIAVAVDYRKSDDAVPSSSLLYFNFRGDPLQALALDASREARHLTVDGDSNVWTLTMGAGERKPSGEPMAVGYKPSGEVLKEVAKRSEFPTDASLTQEDDTMGLTGLGHNADSVWFWLPNSTELVTFKTHGSSQMRRFVTGLPKQLPQEVVLRLSRTDAGALLAWVRGSEDDHSPGQFNFFSRSAPRNHWEFYAPPCSQCSLIGVDGGEALFLKEQGGQSEIYEAPVPE
jgi:hypothetical protein